MPEEIFWLLSQNDKRTVKPKVQTIGYRKVKGIKIRAQETM